MAHQAMEACEVITREMGAEIHDDLIQKLTVLRLYLDRLERVAHDPIETVTMITQMRSDFDEVIRSVRTVSRRLMPVLMEEDSFSQNIHVLCQNMEQPGEAHVHLEQTGTEIKIPRLVETYLYRIIQELIHNAFKHSAAWHIWVRLIWQRNKLILEVEDDGTAFSKIPDFVEQLRKKHNTLYMRSVAINAKLSYEKGTSGLQVRLIYKAER